MDLLSTNNIQILKLLSSNSSITDELFDDIVKFSLDTILDKEVDKPPKQLAAVDANLLKQLHSALVALILESAKVDVQEDQLSMLLDDCNFSTSAKQRFIELFNHHRSDLRDHLAVIGINFPHIVDAGWRLDYNIKNNQIHKVNNLRYTISLSTADDEEVKFTCSREELQDLFGKLKEASKAIERATQV